MAITQDDMIAELQRTVAALQEKLDAALAQRSSEYGERIEHQAATLDVLKAMSASPGDPQPVFDLIARQAAKLCDVPTAAVATFDGTMVHLATQSGFDAAYADTYMSGFPRPVGPDFAMGRAILNRQVEQVEDITAYPGHSFADVLGHWSVMAVPMLRHDVPLGAITIGRSAIGPFVDTQVALLRTFAEQAVIAITSAEVGAIALLVLDGAGWHSSPRLNLPKNIVLLPLPPYAPELNPMENVWEFMRGNDLSHRVWDGYKAIMLGAGRFVRSRCSAGGARRARM